MPHRFPALIAAPSPGAGRLWLPGLQLFDGTGGPVREGVAVLVEDGVIRRVAAAAEPRPAGAQLIDTAQALGLAEHIGTVAEGKLADLLITDGDPLEEPQLLTEPSRIWLVLQLGVPVAGQALERDIGVAASEPVITRPSGRGRGRA